MSSVSTDTTLSAVPGSVKYTNAADTNVIIMAIRNQACPASGFMGMYQVTSDLAAPFSALQRRYDPFTDLPNKGWAAGVKSAARWKAQQARHICAA